MQKKVLLYFLPLLFLTGCTEGEENSMTIPVPAEQDVEREYPVPKPDCAREVILSDSPMIASAGNEIANIPEIPASAGAVVNEPNKIQNRVFFDFNRYFVNGEYIDVVDRFAQEYKNRYNGHLIVLVGHADRMGGVKVNYMISLQRCLKVQERLVANGIDPDNIIIKPFGKSACNTLEGVPSQNCRLVVMQIYPDKSAIPNYLLSFSPITAEELGSQTRRTYAKKRTVVRKPIVKAKKIVEPEEAEDDEDSDNQDYSQDEGDEE